MARSEARIFTSIWKDPGFLALEPGAQRLYMFLLSQEELTYCGVMPLRVPRWARKAAGLTADAITRDLKALEGTAYPPADPPSNGGARQPFVITDEDTGELLVRSLLRYDRAWKQPNLLKLAMEAAGQIESPRIRHALLAEIRRLPLDETPSAQVRTLVEEFAADLEQGEPYPSAYPPADPALYPPDDPAADPSGNPTDDTRPRGRFPQPPIPRPPNTSLPSQRKAGTRLPDDFALTPDMRSWSARNTPHVNQDREFERFRDYWQAKPGKDGRKLDWVATWRNWMRTAEDRQGPRDRGNSPGASTTNTRVQAGLDLAAKYAAEEQAERERRELIQ